MREYVEGDVIRWRGETPPTKRTPGDLHRVFSGTVTSVERHPETGVVTAYLVRIRSQIGGSFISDVRPHLLVE